jgi:hypothetical protein
MLNLTRESMPHVLAVSLFSNKAIFHYQLLGTTRIKMYMGLMTTSMDRKDKIN